MAALMVPLHTDALVMLNPGASLAGIQLGSSLLTLLFNSTHSGCDPLPSLNITKLEALQLVPNKGLVRVEALGCTSLYQLL